MHQSAKMTGFALTMIIAQAGVIWRQFDESYTHKRNKYNYADRIIDVVHSFFITWKNRTYFTAKTEFDYREIPLLRISYAFYFSWFYHSMLCEFFVQIVRLPSNGLNHTSMHFQ